MEADYFTILYWFCHTSTWIHHGCTRVPHPEPPSHLPPHSIPLGHPSAPALSILYHALNLDWWLISHMILYMFQCHSPKSSHPLPLPLPESKRLFYTSVSLLLSHIQGYRYHLSKFHIYEHPWTLVSSGVLELIPMDINGQLYVHLVYLFFTSFWHRGWDIMEIAFISPL